MNPSKKDVSAKLKEWVIVHQVCKTFIQVNRDSIVACFGIGENESYEELINSLKSEFDNARFVYSGKTDNHLYLEIITTDRWVE